MPKRDQSTKDSKSATLYAKRTDTNAEAYPVFCDTNGHLIISNLSSEIPQNLEGSIYKIVTVDDNNAILLGGILKELKIMNLHLAIVTDNVIQQKEIG